MPTQACLDNVKRSDPPIYCDDIDPGHCGKIQDKINKYCKHNGLGGDTPVPQVARDGRDCWCCCSCFAYDTPIEVTPGEFKFIQDIGMNETVLTTGPHVNSWAPKLVTEIGGMAIDTEMDCMYYLLARMEGVKEDDLRYLITTADHLYLLPDGTLRPVQELHPGDRIRKADGGVATVLFAIPGKYTGGVRHIATGPYEKGEPIDGHLLNSNGLVTADLAVQLAHYSGQLDSGLLAAEKAKSLPQAGTAAFFATYGPAQHPELHEFISDKRAWPSGFTPHTESLFNIPKSAVSFFTQQQAEDIQAHIEQLSPGNSAVVAMVDYLFKVYQAFNPDMLLLIDWSNELPNAYYFKNLRYPMVVINGGLARLKTINRDGLAIILSHLMAAADGNKCVGPADYNGVLMFLRQAWNNDLFFQVFRKGMEQLQTLFDAVDPMHAHENPDDICGQPSLACRIATLNAGAAMDDMPGCALPHPAFRVTGANPDLLDDTVTVDFSELVNQPTAETAENYSIMPGVTITKARVAGDNFKQVLLSVTGLHANKEYVLEVTDVLDEHDHPLGERGRSAFFHTPKK